MVHRVAQQVQQWLADLVEDGAVQLDLLALDPEVHLLAHLPGQVADHAREAVEDLPHRRHARGHDLALERLRQPPDLDRHVPELGIVALGGEGREAAARDGQLADLVHQGVEAAQVHPQVAAPRGLDRRGLVRLVGLDVHLLDVAGGAQRLVDGVGRRGAVEVEAEVAVEGVALHRRHGGRDGADGA